MMIEAFSNITREECFTLLHVTNHYIIIIIPAFFLRKKGYINFVPKSVRHPSVRPSVMFLVNESPPKPLDIAHDVEGTGRHFVRP